MTGHPTSRCTLLHVEYQLQDYVVQILHYILSHEKIRVFFIKEGKKKHGCSHALCLCPFSFLLYAYSSVPSIASFYSASNYYFLVFFCCSSVCHFFSLSFTSSICYFVVIHQIICSVMMFNFTFCSSFSLLCCWPDLWLILFSLLLLPRPCWFYIVFILFFVILFNILFLISSLMIMFSKRWCHCSILDVLWDPASKPRRIMF